MLREKSEKFFSAVFGLSMLVLAIEYVLSGRLFHDVPVKPGAWQMWVTITMIGSLCIGVVLCAFRPRQVS